MENLKKSIPAKPNYNPFSSFQKELDKVTRDFRGWFDVFRFSKDHFENLAITPSIDVVDEKDYIKIEAEMPGMNEADIQVSVSDHLLSIKAEKNTSTSEEDKNYMIREIHYGRYERRVVLPDYVDVEQAKASFKKGILLVNIPKKPESVKKAKVLEIEKG